MNEYQVFVDNHIRNIRNLTNGKSAEENYIDMLRERQQQFEQKRQQREAEIDEKALNEAIRQAAAKTIEKEIQKIFR